MFHCNEDLFTCLPCLAEFYITRRNEPDRLQLRRHRQTKLLNFTQPIGSRQITKHRCRFCFYQLLLPAPQKNEESATHSE